MSHGEAENRLPPTSPEEEMFEVNKRVFDSAKDYLQVIKSEIVRMLKAEAPLYALESGLTRWNRAYEEVVDAERTLHDCCPPSTRLRHERACDNYFRNCTLFRDQLEGIIEHVQATEEESRHAAASESRAEIRERLARETEELRHEIRNITSRISAVARDRDASQSPRPLGTPYPGAPTGTRPSTPAEWASRAYHAPPFQPRSQPYVIHPDGTAYYGTTPSASSTHQPHPHVPRPPQPFTPPSAETQTKRLLKQLADVILAKDEKLPPLEPDVFEGDMLTYPAWWSSFQMTVEDRTPSAQRRLFYLGKYTSGRAYKAIKGHLDNPDHAEGYAMAKSVLQFRYGDQIKVADAFRDKLNSWPSVRKGDALALQRYSDFLNQTLSAMKSMSYLDSLDSREENRKLVQKIPLYLAERWDRIVDKALYGSADDENSMYSTAEGTYPSFADYCRFIEREARVTSMSCVSRLSFDSRGPAERPASAPAKGNPSRRPVVNKSDARRPEPPGQGSAGASQGRPPNPNPTPSRSVSCAFCKGTHAIAKCRRFLDKPVEDRKQYAREHHLCFGCLDSTHGYRACRWRDPALTGDPPVFNHEGESRGGSPTKGEGSPAKESKTATVNQVVNAAPQELSTMVVQVRLSHVDHPEWETTTYALLDTQSDTCFMHEGVASDNNWLGEKVPLEIRTMGNECEVDCWTVDKMVVSGLDGEYSLRLPTCYTRDNIQIEGDNLPLRSRIEKWAHLRHLAPEFPEQLEEEDIGLLIGFNCPEAFAPLQTVLLDYELPYCVRTPLGWTAMGRMNPDCQDTTRAPRLCFKTSTRELSDRDLARVFNVGFETSSADEMLTSAQDVKFLQLMKDGLQRLESGRVQLPLPFKNGPEHVPNNRAPVLKRLLSLKRKLLANPTMLEKYCEFMSNMFLLGHAEEVTEDQRDREPVWYVPHHAVINPKKPDKLRVVFDMSIEFRGVCLNSLLLTGPDLLNNLVGVLLRFRQETVAICCDIEGMFHQVRVNPEHRDYIRFLWFADGNPEGEIREYRMAVHLFGAASSPGCANYTMRYLADTYEAKYGPEVADFVRRRFYVDDGLSSMATPVAAVSMFHGARSLCAEGCLNLHKLASNSKEVIQAIPPELRAKELKGWGAENHSLPQGRTLGSDWDQERDLLRFLVALAEDQTTRRGMLSVLSGVFDPMGLIGPALLPGRRLLQEVCRDTAGWDDPVSPDIRERWCLWCRQMKDIERLEIPRCLRGSATLPLRRVELHTFSDASTSGFGTCSYLVLRGESGVDSNLIYAKSRVPPTRAVTIPRLELQAAVLAARTSTFLLRELDYPVIYVYHWSDSQIVLGYIFNEGRRFHVYVTNRVQLIRDLTETHTWSYIATDQNPADLASRGVPAAELLNNTLWWHGPEIIRGPSSPSPADQRQFQVEDDDPEVKTGPSHNVTARTYVSVAHRAAEPGILNLLSSVSRWRSMIATVAWWHRYVTNLRARAFPLRYTGEQGPLTVAERSLAEHVILEQVQREAYPEELNVLRDYRRDGLPVRQKALPRRSSLYKLDVFLSRDGLLRVGGRITSSTLPARVAQPILLPRTHFVSRRLAEHVHASLLHVGRTQTLAAVRSAGYWICQARTLIGSIIGKCVPCRRHRGRTQTQKMADLPSSRTTESPPFTYCGTDFFGPFLVKQNRAQRKRWGCLFTCMAMRAVHLEVAWDLTAESFIQAYRRLVSRRGPVRVLYCDCGTNYVGASNELSRAVQEMDLRAVAEQLSPEGCDLVQFSFNPPRAPHMGGVWERAVQTVKTALYKMLRPLEGRLDDEDLITLFAEAESLVNSRPLTFLDSSSADSGLPISPAQLLTLKSSAVAPLPGVFTDTDIYARNRWRRVQRLAQTFWETWRTEFLPTLQARSKWQLPEDNLREEDVVIVAEEGAPRASWPLAIVETVHPSRDGLVRRVTLRRGTSTFDRPITRLVLLYRKE